ncbi:hypothetical protein GQ55_5G098700 [Panicum hallii var. hallii]|uniref:Uncharacterized protein n=1 Tax=Panicum hallii var. hallii TaxID=1504633 RepID=A0A2T7DES6_9POAL|nr:hypothetical protein GQ55_5G098700 [Panicum hallii var. hallii]
MHLFSECRFTGYIWADISTWLAELLLHPTNWKQTASVHEWCLAGAQARIFNGTEAPSFVVATKIRDEASLWTMAGAMHLARLIDRV